MGVPKFFSWITKRYPLILEQTQQGSLPEIDYLYLDMNGIIYKCSKDESIIFKSMVLSKELEEIWLSIFNYISNIVDIIQPKKLLFLGLDGVAPRSKMNNQRSRRYNSAKSYAAMEERLKNYGETNQQNFKNNCITPGTEFMFELNKRLRFFINKKIEEDPEWQKFRIIFSGGDVPGEGEHKIMDFIREGQKQKIFNQNSKHCLYGADADLIMLAMTLPIKNLCIIREEFIFNKNTKAINISSTKNNIEVVFQLIYIRILKQYFELEYQGLKEHIKHQYNIQKIINDFVFLCFFIGNDFLPRCYCYDIREGFLERLIDGFKEFLINSESYLLDDDNINLVELQRLTGVLRKFQSLFISSRQQEFNELKRSSSFQSDKQKQKQKQINENMIETTLEQPMKNEKQFLLTLKTLYANDDLAGAKKLFYKQKFGLDTESSEDQVTKIIETYLVGLSYVYKYYFKTLPSWQWFYPYYYAPLVNDLHVYLVYLNQNQIQLPKLTLSEPYEPFKQLLCILPKQSFGLLPSCLHNLITSEQSLLRSPFDYFPSEVKIDPYGGKQEHEFISILPFINQEVITKVYDSVNKTQFTEDQNLRNVHNLNQLYVYDPNQAPVKIKSLYQYISDFKVTVVIHRLNFLKDSLRVVTEGIESKDNQQDQNESGIYSFPTLKIREFESKLQSNQRQFRAGIQLRLTLKPIQHQKPIKMGSIIYFGLPNQLSGKVLAMCTKQELITDSKDFDFRDFIRHQQRSREYTVRQIWDTFQDEIQSEYEKRKGVILNETKVLYFVMISKRYVRKRSGKFIRGYENADYKIVPDCLVSTHRQYTYTKIPFVPKDITEEFQLNQNVVILNKDFCGSKGKVIGYSANNKKVRVEITERLNKIPDTIIQKTKANDFFWSLGFVARIFNIDLDTILIMIDSLQIELNRQDPSAQGMPVAIDIGLNYVKRNFKQLVPTLVRLPIHSHVDDINNIYRQFKRLEISTTALELIYKYYMKYPEIFYFMDERTKRIKEERTEWKQRISASDIWELSDNSKKAIEVYLWLIKQEQVHHPNSSINSTKISKARITNLLNYFKSEKAKEYSEIEQFDPNHLISSRLSKEGLIYLKNPPPNHRIGDRVICIKPQQFGETAIIIGIDTTFKDLVFQVLFQKPSFGKDNLGGLVDYLWGGQFNYEDLFNIDRWIEDLEQRGNQDGTGWDGSPPKFVNSDTFKNLNTNRKAEVIERQNFQTIINKLELDNELVEFIKKAAERNPGKGYYYVTKRDQRGMNKLQREEEVLLDSESSKVKYVAKQEVEESKKQKEEGEEKQEEKVNKVGDKVFKKHVFEQSSSNKNSTNNNNNNNNNGSYKKVSYIEKTEQTKTETKAEGKPVKVFQKTRYIEKKPTQQKVEQPVAPIVPSEKLTNQSSETVNISALTVQNQKPENIATITPEKLDEELDRYHSSSSKPGQKIQTNQQSIPFQTQTVEQIKPTETVSVEKQQDKLAQNNAQVKPQETNDPKEEYDQDIFG